MVISARVQRLRPDSGVAGGPHAAHGHPPFSVGGDPIVNPADFRITTFASGLNYPHGMTTLSDGSTLVGLSNPLPGFTDYFDTTGQLLRLVDANGDGVADDAGTVLYDGLPGEITALHQAGPYILATSSLVGQRADLVPPHRRDPGDPLTLAGSINFAFPLRWEHTTFASAVQPTPGRQGLYHVYFNIGSQYNGVVIGDDGSVVLDASGNPIYQPTTDTVGASGLTTGTLQGDSIYWSTSGTTMARRLSRAPCRSPKAFVTPRQWKLIRSRADSCSQTTVSTAMTSATRHGAPTS